MSGALRSASWYRVEGLRPKLRPHVQLSRHRYRGQTWFVLRDPASGRTHRFTPAARHVLNGMDGQRSAGELWQQAEQRMGELAPTQDEFIDLLAQLHAADLVQCDVTPDVAELFQRGERHQRQRRRQAFGNPMSLRIPLWDPDAFLTRCVPRLRWLWNRWGVLAWLAVVLPALLLAASHASELTNNVADRVFASGNLFMLWLLFPLIKLAHELGHGLATRMRGGEVHEMGLMLLVLMPVPYVDASAANTFPGKTDRALVASAGMLVEIFIAACAMYVWLLVEPGLLRSLAFNTLLVAGVSTVLFNANPLLRYDGYYILADLIEMPNLATRANRHIGALLQRTLFRATEVELPPASRSERVWLVAYALASFAYRTWVSVVIILFIAGELFFIGVLLALWALVMMLVMPVVRMTRHLATSPQLARVRSRVWGVSGTLAMLLLGAIVGLPMPSYTQTQGVVWLPEQAIVRAGANGFHTRFIATPGSRVASGEPLLLSTDPALEAQLRMSRARLAELRARLVAQGVRQPVEAGLIAEDIGREEQVQQRLQERVHRLTVVSPSEGVFMVPHADNASGRYHRQGELLGYVSGDVNGGQRPVVRVVVQQGEVDRVRSATREVGLRGAWQPAVVVTGSVVREVPAGVEQLPSRALAASGGGSIVVDPRDNDGTKALQRSFQFDIELPVDMPALFGARVHVRFEHPAEPLGTQGWRSLRQLLLSRFHA